MYHINHRIKRKSYRHTFNIINSLHNRIKRRSLIQVMKYGILLAGLWILPVMAQNFLPKTEDIPLMDGLTRVEETASFDNPAERLVLISAETTQSPQNVTSFYKQTLTNLGWTQVAPNVFKRGSDSFAIKIFPKGKMATIQFRLSQTNP